MHWARRHRRRPKCRNVHRTHRDRSTTLASATNRQVESHRIRTSTFTLTTCKFLKTSGRAVIYTLFIGNFSRSELDRPRSRRLLHPSRRSCPSLHCTPRVCPSLSFPFQSLWLRHRQSIRRRPLTPIHRSWTRNSPNKRPTPIVVEAPPDFVDHATFPTTRASPTWATTIIARRSSTVHRMTHRPGKVTRDRGTLKWSSVAATSLTFANWTTPCPTSRPWCHYPCRSFQASSAVPPPSRLRSAA